MLIAPFFTVYVLTLFDARTFVSSSGNL